MTHDVCIVIFIFTEKKTFDSCWSLYQADIFSLHLENMIDLFSITVLHYNVVLITN